MALRSRAPSWLCFSFLHTAPGSPAHTHTPLCPTRTEVREAVAGGSQEIGFGPRESHTAGHQAWQVEHRTDGQRECRILTVARLLPPPIHQQPCPSAPYLTEAFMALQAQCLHIHALHALMTKCALCSLLSPSCRLRWSPSLTSRSNRSCLKEHTACTRFQ